MKYDVFISYSSNDEDIALSLHSLCKENKLSCFIAKYDIYPGQQDWEEAILDAISNSTVMLCLVSINYNRSKQAKREVRHAGEIGLYFFVYRIDDSDYVERTIDFYLKGVQEFRPSPSNNNQFFIESLKFTISRNVKPELELINERVESPSPPSSSILAQSEDPEAQFYEGCDYEKKNDFEQAILCYRKAANDGLKEACYNAANLILQNKASALSPHEAFDYASKAYVLDLPYAALLLAYCFKNGNGVKQNYDLGWKYLNEFVASGVEEPQSLGSAYCIIANYYSFGWGAIQKDSSQAIAYWKKAAEFNNSDAIFNLGVSYLKGEGVPRDERLAFTYFEKGIRLNDPKCYKGIAQCYRYGINVEQNIEKAISCYKIAAYLGDDDAMACIGSIYAFGEGVPQDYGEAARWFLEAAKRGHATAQKNLAVLYSNGWGVQRNVSEAIKWYKKAASQGDKES